MIITVAGQKGGPGKSTIARALACQFIENDWEVHVADMDKKQFTTNKWAQRRKDSGITPEISVACYNTADQIIKIASAHDVTIVDGSPFADMETLKLAKESAIIVFPVKVGLDDLEPQLNLAHELRMKGIPKKAILFAVTQVPPNGSKEAMSAKQLIIDWDFNVCSSWVDLKATYSKGMDKGLAITEVSPRTLRDKAQSQVNQVLEQFQTLLEA